MAVHINHPTWGLCHHVSSKYSETTVIIQSMGLQYLPSTPPNIINACKDVHGVCGSTGEPAFHTERFKRLHKLLSKTSMSLPGVQLNH